MLINVPQYIDVEDKVAGPLTMKQLGWLLALGIISLILWNMVSGPLFFVMELPLVIFFVAMAFYKPYGQPMGSFVIFGIMYFFRPKVYVWKRMPEKFAPVVNKAPTAEKFVAQKHMSSESVRNLAELLDSEGTKKNEQLEDILNKLPVKKA